MSEGMRLTVVVRATLRGEPLAGDGALRLEEDVLTLVVGETRLETNTARLAGMTWRAPTLALHLVGGDVVELGGHPGLEQVARHVTARALAFPEMTRALHALGSPRGEPGSDHDRYFGGLLRARRFVEENHELEPRLAAFSGRRLVEGFTRTIGEMAAERHPERAPDRRALEAELLEAAERLFEALLAMDERATELRQSVDRRGARRIRRRRPRVGAVAPRAGRFARRARARVAPHDPPARHRPLPARAAARGRWRGRVIVGIGMDLIDIARIERLLADKGERALARLFTPAERDYAMRRARPAQHLASRLAAKEAAFKALAGSREARAIGWRDIEVVVQFDGRPTLAFHGAAKERAGLMRVARSWVTMTHSATTAGAVVVLESDEPA